jgi:hypothetical protein
MEKIREASVRTGQKHEAFYNVFPDPLRCPLTKTRSDVGFNAIADGDYGVEIVELCIVIFAICGSY